jgi:YD repeat-containing protein
VNQGNQTRAFKYDAEGKLLFERIPEMSATINDGTGTYWSTKYTYTDWGAVSTKQDARGVISTYGYDTLHRLTSISYNSSGAPGVATTPNVSYTFDNSQTSTTKGLLLSLAVGTGYSESYSYDSFKRVQSVTRTIDGRNYTTSYQFDTANQVTQMTYPSNRVINIGHDSKGGNGGGVAPSDPRGTTQLFVKELRRFDIFYRQASRGISQFHDFLPRSFFLTHKRLS